MGVQSLCVLDQTISLPDSKISASLSNRRSAFEAEMKKARRRISKLDAVDGCRDRLPGTIMAALEAGLIMPESGAQFEALVMLQEVYEAWCLERKSEHN